MEQNHCLLFFGRRRIYLRASLTVGHHAIKANAASKRGLAVALAHFDVGATIAARAIRQLPAEQRSNDKRLTDVKVERDAFKLAFAQPQHLGKETDHAVGSIFVKINVVAFKVGQVPLALIADVRTCTDLAGHDLLGILVDNVGH